MTTVPSPCRQSHLPLSLRLRAPHCGASAGRDRCCTSPAMHTCSQAMHTCSQGVMWDWRSPHDAWGVFRLVVHMRTDGCIPMWRVVWHKVGNARQTTAVRNSNDTAQYMPVQDPQSDDARSTASHHYSRAQTPDHECKEEPQAPRAALHSQYHSPTVTNSQG
jgi:hypothetical protein